MTRKLTPAQLDEIEKVARDALSGSPQGWTAHREDDYDYSVDAGGDYLGGCPDCGTRPSFDEEDATHIAAFDPPAALALIAEVRELRAKVKRVRAEVDAEVQRAQHRPGESKPDVIRRSMSRAITGRIIKALGEEA